VARVVRKVSNKAVKGQKRERKGLLFSKKFWIILISIVVVLTAAGITIGVVVANNNSSSATVEVDDYFGQTQKYNNTDVNFTKMTYEGVALHTNPESELVNDYTFVFAADLSTFYPFDLIDTNNDDTNLKNSKHTQIFNLLVELQYTIDTFAAKNNYDVKLYIVNTEVADGNGSSSIYENKSFVPTASSDSSFAGPLFCLLSVDGLQESVSTGNVYATSYTDSNKMASAIDNAIKFVNSLE